MIDQHRVFRFAPLLFFVGVFGLQARPPAPLRFSIPFPEARSAQALDRRVLLFISDDEKTEPRMQTDQYRANSTPPIFGVDIDGLKPGQDVIVDDCFTGDTENPNNVASRTVHQRYMPAMAKWIIKTAPQGADTKSWVY